RQSQRELAPRLEHVDLASRDREIAVRTGFRVVVDEEPGITQPHAGYQRAGRDREPRAERNRRAEEDAVEIGPRRLDAIEHKIVRDTAAAALLDHAGKECRLGEMRPCVIAEIAARKHTAMDDLLGIVVDLGRSGGASEEQATEEPVARAPFSAGD